jgi:metallophosphoesterase (TIGR00282 family)
LKTLFLGDIIGKPGRKYLKEKLQDFRNEKEIDLCIANGENGSGGFGLTPESARELFSTGIDVLTSGNHIWDRRVIMPFLDNENRLLRPANYPAGAPGKGDLLYHTANGIPVGIINLQGRVFMHAIDCPFRTIDPHLDRLKKDAKVILVDFHAEATAEKLAMGWFLSGKVSGVIGTHTHVQTADERILEGGTAYITDVGLTGSISGVIGMRKKEAIQRFTTQLPRRFVPETADIRMMGVIIDIDENTGEAISIQRITCT